MGQWTPMDLVPKVSKAFTISTYQATDKHTNIDKYILKIIYQSTDIRTYYTNTYRERGLNSVPQAHSQVIYTHLCNCQ